MKSAIHEPGAPDDIALSGRDRWPLVREAVVAILLALLLIPTLVATVTGFVAPTPWRVSGPKEVAPTLVGVVFARIALPLVTGLWLRRWWWGVLCFATVLAAAFAWQGGQPVYTSDFLLGPSEPAMVSVFPTAVGSGLLAAAAGTAGVARGQGRFFAGVQNVKSWTAACLVPAPVSVFVGLTLGSGTTDTTLGVFSYFMLLVASTLGALAAGYWLRQWWWPAVCLIGTGVMAFWSGVFYFGSAYRYGFGGLGFLVAGAALAVISAVCAGVGVVVRGRFDSAVATQALSGKLDDGDSRLA